MRPYYLLDRRFGAAPPGAPSSKASLRAAMSPGLDSTDYEAALVLDGRYADLNLGLADLSVIVLWQARDPAHPDLDLRYLGGQSPALARGPPCR
jgi:mannose-6-phosphate isomerase-like protein (cupin superfamily)/DNA-binding XRE family transcriptional regulator